MALNGDKFGESLPLGDGVCLGKLPCEVVGDTNIPSLVGFDRMVQAFQDIIDGCLMVPHMIDVQIYIIHAKILEALVQRPADMLLTTDIRLAASPNPMQMRETFKSELPSFVYFMSFTSCEFIIP